MRSRSATLARGPARRDKPSAITEPKFEALLDHLRSNRGFDFTGYKRSGLMRRVLKHMQAARIQDFGDYLDYLEVHPEEFTQLFNTILINVTAFFRDEAAWDYLGREVLARIVAGKPADDPIRIWSAGCASGEEAYTLAILASEALGPKAFQQRVKIYATDVDEEALAKARQGCYNVKELQSMPAGLRDRYFEECGDRYVFRNELRRSIIFGRHDLVQDAPISHLDLLVCRNTLMYFNAETQARILARFHFALGESGFLFLGKAEMVIAHASLFSPVDLKHRIFVKMPRSNYRERLLALAQAGDAEAVNHLGRHVRLREVSFDGGVVAQVVVDLNGNLALANERARALFSLSPKDVGRPLQDLELCYRPAELRSPIEQAYAERRAVKLTGIERRFPGGDIQYLDVQVLPLGENGGNLLGVSITFDDVTHLLRLQADLQRATHELGTSYEELQSTHEELETTNEELQSTNEELETMNEELQSTNEELQTTNDELHGRGAELHKVNAFLRSILASLRSAVVVVDRQLSVQIWNHRAEDLWGLRADEVHERSLLTLDIGLPIDRLPLAAFLAGKAEYEEIVLAATDRRGRAIHCHITCTPFLGPEGDRVGVILVMEETRP